MSASLKKIQDIQRLPEEQQSFVLAMSIVLGRVKMLSEDDRDDLCQMFKLYSDAENEEDRSAANEGIWELLLQEKFGVHQLELGDSEEQADGDFDKWKRFVANRVAGARKQARLTQEELAEKSGLPQSHISRIECGKLSPSTGTLEKIASALGVSPSSLDPSL